MSEAFAGDGPDETAFEISSHPSFFEIKIDHGFGLVLNGNLVMTSAFFQKPEPAPCGIEVIVFDLHVEDGAAV